MPKIHLLEKSVYEIIAAGEVIDRPAAAVKELVENAIDAGATKLTVEIKNGGRTYIRVTDNGCGMNAEDVPLAFVRHATSKVATKADLVKIFTLGFRGEALASICAVARVEVMTKTADSANGYHYRIEGGEEIESGEIGCPDGTTFIVENLFFNIPARQKFMKKDVTEGNYISDIVQKLALSHPDVSVKFIRDNKLEFVTPGDGKLLSCIYVILGNDFYKNCMPVDYSYLNIHVTGYITRPLGAYASRANQIFFVNSRYIKCLTGQYALEEGYKDKMMVSKFPGCVLNIDIEPEYVDVNYHPSKLQVRFKDDSIVFNAVLFAVRNSIMLYDTPPEIRFGAAKDNKFSRKEIYAKPQDEDQPVQMNLSSAEPAPKYEEDPELLTGVIKASLSCDPNPADKSNDISSDTSGGIIVKEPPTANADNALYSQSNGYKYISNKSFSKPEDKKAAETSKDIAAADRPAIRVIGEAFKTYIIAECEQNVILIDKHAAHERYIYEQLKAGQTDLEIQMLIEPLRYRASGPIYDAVSENLDLCRKLGFEVMPLPSSFLLISGVPAIADNVEPLSLIERVGMAVVNKNEETSRKIFDDIYHTIACKAAIKANSDNDRSELEKIVSIVTEDELRYCPHGRPILIKLTKNEIDKMFKRIK